MLDWFSGYVGYGADHLVLGSVMEVEPGGELVRSRDRWETARGSFEKGVQITRGQATSAMIQAGRDLGFLCGGGGVYRVSGNPVKFLQGHNAAGPSVSLLGPVLQAMFRGFPAGLRPAEAEEERLPSVHRSRVDVNVAVDLGSDQAVHDWLRLAAQTTRSRHGRAIDSKGSVYWGKSSRRWEFKAYCKHCELKVPGRGVADPELQRELLAWTYGHLRLELLLRRPELKSRGTLSEEILWEYARKLEMPTMENASRVLETEGLRPAVRAALQIWLDGHDVASMFPRATLYRHRRQILEAVGVDITMPVAEQIEAKPNALLGIEELQRRQVVEIPRRVQRSLFGSGL